MNSIEGLLSEILWLAYDMLVMGSEVSRAERNIERMCLAYDMEEVEVFVITSSIVVSAKDVNGKIYTQTKRIRAYKTDFGRLSQIERLIEFVCERKPEPKKIMLRRLRIEETLETENGISAKVRSYGTYCCLCMVFTLFFGGNIRAGICSFLVGLVAKLITEFIAYIVSNRFVTNMVISICVAFVACILGRAGFTEAVDKVMIGNIMLLIPGLAMINSFKDLVGGETMSGILRLAESLVQAIAIALGFVLVLLPMGI